MSEPNLRIMDDKQLSLFVTDLIKEYIEAQSDPTLIFFTTQDVIERIADIDRYVTKFDLNLSQGYNVQITTVTPKPEDWDFTGIREYLREAFQYLSAQSLIIYGYNLEYNRPYVNLSVGFHTGEKKYCIDFKKADKKDDING